MIRRSLRAQVSPPPFPNTDRQAGQARRGSHDGHPPVFDPPVHRRRNVAERRINRLKQWRSIAPRFDELARNRAAIVLVTAVR
ncbi:hypothetical protein [Actinomadura keratinilytica]|jgi:transposase|uniref:Transposase DDE domain-containing protein n=1 Tax=Actinomadura keratinilytica TaxID=547461 RepID=A0ABP7Y525_9ACTN